MPQQPALSDARRPDAESRVMTELETLIRRDPGRRGLCSTDAENPLCPGHLAEAALHLAEEADDVAIVTGFWVARGTPAACETDGPLGALFLASVFKSLGIRVRLMTDAPGMRALSAGMRAVGLPQDMLVEFPGISTPADNQPSTGNGQVDVEGWLREFYGHGPGSELTHLVAIERVGPSHTVASLGQQTRPTEVPLGDFLKAAPAEHHDHYHNMLGHVITEHHAPIHRLFEFVVEQDLPIRTIGIGDGGNEIGMGRIAWEEIHRRISGGRGGLVACRVPAHHNVIAGTSNWGGYALAAAVLWCRGQVDLLRPLDRDRELDLLETLVEEGPLVDGVTGRQEPTVDGLPFETYIQALEGIRHIMLR